MNDKIKQLAEQADAYATSEYAKWIPTPDFFGVPHIRKIFNERFAQLIISECINQLNKPEYAMNHPEDLSAYNRGWVNGRLLGIEHIEQHFRS